MTNIKSTHSQVSELTSNMISLGLCNYQNFPFVREIPNGLKEITFSKNGDLNIVLKNQEYKKIYDELNRLCAYNFKMLDGALIQLMYIFDGDNLKKHRLAFFPSPYLDNYENDPEIYDNDEIYADIIAKNIVPFPFRFDYDSKKFSSTHPKSHLTLGQYKNCRIPVSAPLTPYEFVCFILKNFYNTAYCLFSDKITRFNNSFPDTIMSNEREILHIQLATKERI